MAEINERSLASVIDELKAELKEFLRVRVSLMSAEMKDKMKAVKGNLPIAVIGAILLITAWFLLTGALTAAVAVAFGENAFAWTYALLIVGGGYAIFGGIGFLFAYRGLTQMGVLPHRTINVLKADREWLNQEARSET